ncbi:MAG: hypothetical protein WKF81_10435 [Thermomicrobiales bacterium]
MSDRIKQKLIDPFVIPIVVIAVLIAVIITVGELLLSVVTEGTTKDRLDRPELWMAVGAMALIIFGFGFLASRPQSAMPMLNKPVLVGGDRAFFDPLRPPLDEQLRQGQLGGIDDIQPGFTLYAQSGALAKVLGVLPGGNDYGKQFAGFFYATGLFGASKELWVPFEAVLSVYPETKIAFLAIKGDETEHFGWNLPPESLRRGEPRINEELH